MEPSASKLSSPNPVSKPGLAQAIFDEFLVCKICLDGYKNPKCLECLHTFCEQCIDSHVNSESSYKKYSDYREFTCPLCRKRTQLPVGGCKKLPDNFLVSNLSEMIGRQRPSKFPFCDFCKLVDNRFREAHSKCLDCSKMLCSSCVTEHQEITVTSNHSVFDVEIEKDISCKEHPDEMIRFYCEPCETCVCVVCTFKEHRQHKVTQFGQAVVNYKHIMQDLITQCKAKITSFDEHIASLVKCERVISDVRMKIRQTSHAFIDEIHIRERLTLDEVDSIYGKDCIENISHKSELTNKVETLRSTCKLAETIVHGKDIELLLLRKDVQEKLTLLNQLDLELLPVTVNKRVEFSSGSIEFGSLREQNVVKSIKSAPFQLRDSTVQKAILSSKEDFETLKPISDSDEDDDEANVNSDESSLSDATTSSSDTDLEAGNMRKKITTKNHAVQTEITLMSNSACWNSKPKTIDQMTMTSVINVQDKAINTRARSMLKTKKNSDLRLEAATGDSALERRIRRK